MTYEIAPRAVVTPEGKVATDWLTDSLVIAFPTVDTTDRVPAGTLVEVIMPASIN